MMKNKNNQEIKVYSIFMLLLISFLSVSVSGMHQISNDLSENCLGINKEVNRSTLYVGGWGPGNYTSIQEAIDNASDGDTIFVYDYSSPYYENIVVDKSLKLVGENMETTTIDGNDNNHVIHIIADNVIVTGFTIQHCGSGYVDAGVFISSNYNIISNNIFSNNVYGIRLGNDCSFNQIVRNRINNNSIGLGLCRSSYNDIQINEIWNNSGGIHISSSCLNNISGNNIIQNVNGIVVSNGSKANIISGNTIINNSMFGIFIVSVGSCSEGNIMYHNNFINNAAQAYDSCGNIWNVGYPVAGNYWNDFDEPGEGAYDDFQGPNQNEEGYDDIVDLGLPDGGVNPYVVPPGHANDIYPFIRDNGWYPYCGDTNDDGLITPSDAFLILNYIAGGLPPVSLWAANVNGDENITPADAYYLLNWFGGGPDLNCQPCNE